MVQTNNNILKNQVVYKNQKLNADNVFQIAYSLANEISEAIHDEMESVDIFNEKFKKQLNFVFIKILKNIFTAEEKTSVYYEAIPGFSLISLRKTEAIKIKNNKAEKKEIIEAQNELSFNDVNDIIVELAKKYFDKTNSNIMVIENDFCFMLFFPVSDLKKNLKDLGFYYIK